MRDGRLKILDFGLAKRRGDRGDASPASTTDTLTSPGTVLGTVGYLAPEQLRGEPATFASDQFAAGCVLYEMLAGRRAFPGASPAEIASAILRDEPLPLDAVRPGLPPPLVWVVERCLAKLPRDRYGSTSDLARDLRTLKDHSGEVLRSSGSSSRRFAPPRIARRGLLAAGVVGAGAALAALLVALRPSPPVPEFRRLTFRDGNVWKALLEPHATSIVYSASWDSGAPRLFRTAPEVAGMDRPIEAPAFLPFTFDASGARVLGLLGPGRPALNLSGTLAWLPAPGGTPRTVAERVGWADARGGVLVAVRDAGESRVLEVLDASGRRVRELFSTSGAVSWVRISPDGARVAFLHHPWRYASGGEVVVARVDGSSRGAVTPSFENVAGLDWNARTGEIWFTAQSAQDAGGTLWAVSPKGRRRIVHRGLEFYVLQAVRGEERRAVFTVGESRASLLVRRRGEPLRNLSWLGWSSVRDISPDGRTILFSESGTGAVGSFVRPSDGSGTAVPLGGFDAQRFSPDGTSVVGLAGRGRADQQVVVAPVGPGAPQALTEGPATYDDAIWAGPGRVLARRSGAGKGARFVLLDVAGRSETDLGPAPCRIPAATRAGTRLACIASPDWRRILVRDLVPAAPSRVLFALPEGGDVLARVAWSDDGARLFAVTTGFRLLTLDASTGGVVSDETLALPPGDNRYIGAALWGDASLAVYTSARESSALFVGEGLE